MNDLEKIIFERYPVTKKERRCSIEKARMEMLRSQLKKRLINEFAGKENIQSFGGTCKSQV